MSFHVHPNVWWGPNGQLEHRASLRDHPSLLKWDELEFCLNMLLDNTHNLSWCHSVELIDLFYFRCPHCVLCHFLPSVCVSAWLHPPGCDHQRRVSPSRCWFVCCVLPTLVSSFVLRSLLCWTSSFFHFDECVSVKCHTIAMNCPVLVYILKSIHLPLGHDDTDDTV